MRQSDRTVVTLGSVTWAAWLYSLTGANPAGADHAYLAADCKAVALNAERRKVLRVAHWSSEDGILRVSRFDGAVYVLDGESIGEEANGETVLFNDDPTWQSFQPDFDNADGDLSGLTGSVPNWEMEAAMYGLGLRAWYVSTFFSDLCPTRPLLVMEGEKGSSTTGPAPCLASWWLCSNTLAEPMTIRRALALAVMAFHQLPTIT